MVTKFQNVDIFHKIWYILVLSSAHARRIVSVLTSTSSVMFCREMLTLAILKLNEDAKLDALRDRWWTERTQCKEESPAETKVSE